MNVTTILAVLVIGFAAGLRTLTPPAVVAWCAYLGCINLEATPFSFMASPITLVLFSICALGEYVVDLLPSTPNRTAPPGLISRILIGSFTAACLLAATNNSLALCVFGGVAAICGAFVGLQLRLRIVKLLGVKDPWVAIPEDFLAIGLSLFAVCLLAAR